MNENIHPTAIIDPSAQIADDVVIGPWTLIGPSVTIGAGSNIASHVVIRSDTSIGKNNKIFQFSSIGEDTADLKYKGEKTRLVIGDNNVIREGVTIHRGTVQDRSETTIGNDNLIMAYVHIGHDCIIGNHCILVNNAAFAGHVVVDDWVIISGFTLVHQFCRVGAHSFTGMGSAISKDVPACVMVTGAPASARSINIEGLKRRGFSQQQISDLNKAFKVVYRKNLTLEDAVANLKAEFSQTELMLAFIESLESSTRGILR